MSKKERIINQERFEFLSKGRGFKMNDLMAYMVSKFSNHANGEKFIKSKESENKISLYTAVKTYEEKQNNLEVKLAGDIHFGKETYFKNMIKALNTQDKILYEQVASEKLLLKEKFSIPYLMMISTKKYYKSLKTNLGLSYRPEVLEKILKDENLKEKWEHCDITAKEFINHEKTDEEIIKYLGAILTTPLACLLSKKSPETVKMMMAKAIGKANLNLGDTIIGFREKKVKARLKKLCKTKTDYKIGVFYGAGHMPSLSDYLTKNLGFEKKDEKWFKAFDAENKLDTNVHLNT